MSAEINQLLNRLPSRYEVNPDISEEEIMEIYNEMIQIMIAHNVTFEMATKIATSFAYAFQMGEMELRTKYPIIP